MGYNGGAVVAMKVQLNLLFFRKHKQRTKKILLLFRAKIVLQSLAIVALVYNKPQLQ